MNKQFGEFRLGDIFEKLPIKKAKKDDLRKKPSDEYSVPVVYAKYGDNGIMYWGRKDKVQTYANTISIVYNGVISAGKVYAQERKTGILAESYLIRLKGDPDIPFEANLYMAIVIERTIYPKYSRENLATWDNKVENDVIKLPIKESGKAGLDFSYMQRIILTQKEKYKKDLMQFLKERDLYDCKLSTEEQAALRHKPNMHQFRMGDLFEKLKSPYKGEGRKQDCVSRVRTSEYSLPLINCKDGDNGVMYYGRKQDFTSHKNVLSIIYNGPPTEGQTYYQEEIGLYTDAYIIGLRGSSIYSSEVGLYLATAINKSIHNLERKKYSRGNKATWENKVENDKIFLPVDDAGNPDWKYMDQYIKAIEKILVSKIAV